MKMIKEFLALILVVIVFSFSACSDDDGSFTNNQSTTINTPLPTLNLAELADSTDDLDSFYVALTLTGLDAILSDTDRYTALAPSNAAFRTALNNNGATRLSQFNISQLTQLLEYHILLGEIKSSDLNDDYYAESYNNHGVTGENIVVEVDVTDGVFFNNTGEVISADIAATNGRIHIIDSLITPFNIYGPILFDERFDSLNVALTRQGYTFIATITGQGSGPFTIFAPTNEAFVDLLDSTPIWNSVSDIPNFVLESVLESHIILNSNLRSNQLTQGQTIQPINSNTLTVDITNGVQLTNLNNATSNIIGKDYQGSNGVVHAINQVLR